MKKFSLIAVYITIWAIYSGGVHSTIEQDARECAKSTREACAACCQRIYYGNNANELDCRKTCCKNKKETKKYYKTPVLKLEENDDNCRKDTFRKKAFR
ncbi:MAG TPA: hypothetical protein VEL47_04210 [Myxococcota bacterium]|nr:hypothetical protein [Myxococcota bacterium]